MWTRSRVFLFCLLQCSLLSRAWRDHGYLLGTQEIRLKPVFNLPGLVDYVRIKVVIAFRILAGLSTFNISGIESRQTAVLEVIQSFSDQTETWMIFDCTLSAFPDLVSNLLDGTGKASGKIAREVSYFADKIVFKAGFFLLLVRQFNWEIQPHRMACFLFLSRTLDVKFNRLGIGDLNPPFKAPIISTSSLRLNQSKAFVDLVFKRWLDMALLLL